MRGPNYKRSLDVAETGSKLRLYEQSKLPSTLPFWMRSGIQ